MTTTATIKTPKNRWPETVPILEASDICKGSYTQGEQHCLSGWVSLAFNGDPQFKAYRTVITAADEMGLNPDKYCNIPSINDHEAISEEMLARVWNRARAKLGYVIDNPECTPTGKLNPVK